MADFVRTGWPASFVISGRFASKYAFQLRGIHTDYGGEFINETMHAFCQDERMSVWSSLTPSRPYRKNDQARVEQKNGPIVRRLVGYGRLEGLAAAEALGQLYSSSRLFINLFQPSFNLLEKQRTGSRVTKRYEAPATPCNRLLSAPSVDGRTKYRLRAVMLTLDPLKHLEEVRQVQHHVADLAMGEKSKPCHAATRIWSSSWQAVDAMAIGRSETDA